MERLQLLVDDTLLAIVVVLVLAAVLLLHRIQKLGGLGIAPVAEAGDVKSSHHVMVFVDQIVAVEHVDTIVRCVTGDDGHNFILAKQDDILEGLLFVVEYWTCTA